MSAGTIINRIRALRFEHGEMSQADLGQRIGVTRQTIAAIDQQVRDFGEVGVSLDAIFQWKPEHTI